MSNVSEIVNAALLQQFQGKEVRIIGLVTESHPNGTSFDIRSTDNIMVKVILKTPLDRPVEGYVEVHGTSQGKSIVAKEFIIFENKEFHASLYNKLCSYLYSVPNIWDCGPNCTEDEDMDDSKDM